MAVNDNAQKSLFEEEEESEITFKNENNDDQQLLHSLFSKERETSLTSVAETLSRKEGVEWIVRVNSHHGFSALTAILAVNYFDRFLFDFQKDKPWALQLVAVASLSLAAKLEETTVPLLLDLQVYFSFRFLASLVGLIFFLQNLSFFFFDK